MARTIGIAILLVGAGVTAYAALAFSLINPLPPNSPTAGRLPSLWLMFGGMAGMLLGSVIRGFGCRTTKE